MEKTWVRKLSNILENEREIVRTLSEIAERKTNVILSGDIQELEKMLGEERPLLMQMEHCEKRRLALLREARMESTTLSEVAQTLDETPRQNLLDVLHSFQGILARVKKANDVNARLIHSRLDFYQSLQGDGELYRAAGAKPAPEVKQGLMDVQG